jgi:hypothetical protein
VSSAPTVVSLTVAGGTYGSTVPGSATVAGPDGQAHSSLDGIAPTINYYAGNSATGTPLSGVPTAAGTYTAVASFAGDANYQANTSNPTTYSITPASLVITADNQTMHEGDAVPTLTVQYSGFITGETVATLTTKPTVTTSASSASTPGDYPITASGAVDPNYNITYVAGTLTVTPPASPPAFTNGPPPTTAVVDTPYSFTYTASGIPAPTFQVTANALPPGLTLDANTGAITGMPTMTGTFTGTVTASSSSGTTTQNFSITVSAAPTTTGLSVVGSTYGSPIVATTTVAGPDGIVHSSLEAVAPTIHYFAGTSTSGTPLAGVPTAAGTYTAVANFGGSANFQASSSTPVTFTIAPASLIITADNQTMIQGAALPLLSVHYAGFVNGDTAASLSLLPTVTTSAAASSVPGAYGIFVTGAVDPNYTITFVPGTLTIIGLTLTTPAVLKAHGLVAAVRGIALHNLPPTGLITVRVSTTGGSLSLSLKGLKVAGNHTSQLRFSSSAATLSRALNAIMLKFTRPHSHAKITVQTTFDHVTRSATIRVI